MRLRTGTQDVVLERMLEKRMVYSIRELVQFSICNPFELFNQIYSH